MGDNMREFLLNYNNSKTISLFSFCHILMICITLLLIITIILNKNKFIKLNDRDRIIIRYIFGIILILNMIIRRGSFIFYGVYDWHYHLDINFCNFTSIMFILYTFTGNKKILNICYHMSFIGPFLAIIMPSYNLNPLGYSFYSFVLLHHIIFIFSFIFIFTEKLEWTNKLLFNVIEFLIIYYVTIFVFDYFFKVNYNFPLTFVNKSLIKLPIISNIVDNNIIVFVISFIVIIMLLLLGNIILKKITKGVNTN